MKQGWCIINMSSVVGVVAMPGNPIMQIKQA
jgi:hypothetical protein